jgi:hypothetical protein
MSNEGTKKTQGGYKSYFTEEADVLLYLSAGAVQVVRANATTANLPLQKCKDFDDTPGEYRLILQDPGRARIYMTAFAFTDKTQAIGFGMFAAEVMSIQRSFGQIAKVCGALDVALWADSGYDPFDLLCADRNIEDFIGNILWSLNNKSEEPEKNKANNNHFIIGSAGRGKSVAAKRVSGKLTLMKPYF